MNAKHTPGPWKAVARPINSTLWRTRIIADECRENIVADTYTQHYGPGKDESEANARLIAVAPDLLEALEGILNNLWKDRKRNVRRDYSLMLYEAAAQAAIRKARGDE